MAIVDRSKGGIGEPAVHGYAITPDNNTDLAYTTRAIWVGGAGAVKVTLFGGDTVTLSGVAAGTLLPLRVTRVFSTGTDATLMVGLY
jgi:hypothetical protein